MLKFSIMNKKRAGLAILGAVTIMVLAAGLAACGSAGGPVHDPGGGDALALAVENATPAAAVGDIIQLGGSGWRVLEVKDGAALVLSEKILFRMPYQPAPSGYEFYTMAITWEECALRQHLNGQFYDDTFSSEEKARIVETTIKTNDNPWLQTPGGNDTLDKVFLLSTEEVLQYFGDSGGVANWHLHPEQTFIDDQFNADRIAVTEDGTEAWWWFRSPGANFYMCDTYHILAASTTLVGGMGVQGNYVSNIHGGVRPALWLKL